MGGKSSKATIGYWYHPAFHMGISLGPIDALLEIRGGDKTAWTGQMTASGIINVNAPNLWGGEKDQGGIAGDFDVMFGEPTQQPNAYLTATFGNQQPAWRGLTTIVFKGGRYGAMNPYPQKISYKGLKIAKGWDGDPGDGSACWYPAKAAVPVGDASQYTRTVTNFTGGFVTNAPTKFQIIDGAIANTAVNASENNADYWRAPIGVTNVTDVYFEFQLITLDEGDPITLAISNAAGQHILDFNPRTEIVNDPQGRPAVNYFGSLIPILSTPLSAGVAYSFEASIDAGGATYTYWLRQDTTVLATGSAAVQASGKPAYLAFGRSSNSSTSSTAKCTLARVSGGGMAMNPAHTLYYARTQQHMGREPAANIDDASHKAAADWFYAQAFGLCWDYDPSQESVDDFIARIEKVSGCSQTRSPVDGKWYLDVANGAYDLASLPILTDDDILDFQRQPTTLDSAVNSVSVQYFDPEKKTDAATPPVQALALVNAFGTIHQDITYKELPTSGLALRVADRELRSTVTPTNGFDITTSRVTFDWRRGTYFRLQSPKRGIADMVCLLGDKDDGTLKSGAIKITCAQDIYSLPAASFVQQEPGVDTRPPPIPLGIVSEVAFEAPYFQLVRSLSRADLNALTDDVGYFMTVGADPGAGRGYTVIVSTDGGSTFAGNATGVFCPTALIVEGDARVSGNPATAFTLTDGSLLTSVVAGSAALWDGEICRVDAIDAVAGALTLGRGCADTPASAHASNSRIWFFDGFTASDATEYTSGETLDLKLLTTSGSGQIDPSVATPIAITFNERQLRPYAPAGLTVNGSVYPAGIVAASPGNIPIAWVERNRVTQADQLIDTTAATVATEADTTYTVRTYLDDSLVNTQSDIAAVSADIAPGAYGIVRVEIDSVRGGIANWQPLVWTFQYQSALSVATASPIKFITGQITQQQLQASGGVSPFTWSVDVATPLPSGFTMNSSGLITSDGTAALGDTACTFHATDSLSSTASKSITLSVNTLTFVSYVDTLSPVAHFRLDDAVGSTYLNDRIADEHAALSGTYSLDATGLVSGDTDTAVAWTNGYAKTSAGAKWALGTGDFTLFTMFKSTLTYLECFFGVRDGTSTHILALIAQGRLSGMITAYLWNIQTIEAAGSYNDGNAHVVALSYQAATNTARLYVDGALKTTLVPTGTRPTAATMWAGIGANASQGTQPFVGTVDECIAFDSLLTASQIADLSSLALTGALPS